MLIFRVESEQELFDLIYDLVTYGRHQPNSFADLDEDNMSPIDSFDRIPLDMLDQTLHIIDYDIDENGEEIIDGTLELDNKGRMKLRRDKMKFNQEYDDFPIKEEYPILIILDWENSFDRLGDIRYRLFNWISISNIETIDNDEETRFKTTYDLWNKKYK